MTIAQQQDRIIEEFSMLDGDAEMILTYLIEIGQALVPLQADQKIDDYLVSGCQSKVWLIAHEENGCIHFQADSNTAITKGLVGLLIRVMTNQPIEDILTTDLYFMESAGLSRYIGTQRSNGFSAMIKQFKLYALAFKTKHYAR